MIAVAAVLDGSPPPAVGTEPSELRSVAIGVHRQVAVRSLAEQLVAEANAVLGEVVTAGGPCRAAAPTIELPGIELLDDTGVGTLAFSLRFGRRIARVQTTVAGRQAVAELIGVPGATEGPHRLASDEDLEALILSLLGT